MSVKIQTQTPLPSGPKSAWDQPVRHLTRLCLIFMQKLLAAAPEGTYRWSDDEDLTEVLITGQSPINASVVHKRPAIVLIRGPLAWNNISMDDLRGLDLSTNERTYTDMISGTLTMNCMSRVPEVAEDLAFVIGSHFWIMKDLLLQLGFHNIGRGISIDSPSPPGALVSGDTEPSLVNVPVVIPFQFPYTGKIRSADLVVFREAVFHATIRMATPAASSDSASVATGGIGSALLEQGSPPRFARRREVAGNVSGWDEHEQTRDEEPVPSSRSATTPLTMEILVGDDPTTEE